MRSPRWSSLMLVVVTAIGCSTASRRPVLREPSPQATAAAALEQSTFKGGQALKVHHHSGGVDVLSSWAVVGDSLLEGEADRYGVLRELEASKVRVRIPFDSIALLESDNPEVAASFGHTALNAWTVVWGLTTGICVLDPKSCFGSCPTFYLDDRDTNRPVAEGFSSSIARRLEATDLDDLHLVKSGGDRVELRMLNEALETHVVRWVKLKALPLPTDPGASVASTAAGSFHVVRDGHAAVECVAGGADCRRALASNDTIEWHGLTDPDNLGRPDTMVVTFDARAGDIGLLLSARQSFVSTFVLYQTMAWLGEDAGQWLARLERGDPRVLAPLAAVNERIGTVRIERATDTGTWLPVGRYDEAGPIALDQQLMPLGRLSEDGPVRLRFIFARGNWRFGHATVVRVGEAIAPLTLEPTVAHHHRRGDVRTLLADSARTLTLFPGDSVALTFAIPSDTPRYAVFLESRGYYYEWMRGEWLAERDAAMVSLLLADPDAALQEIAPMYKQREATFEADFWNSRFGRQQ